MCGANETIEEQATTVQELNGKLASLDKELCGANETIEEQATTIQELNGKLASLDKELCGANETIEEQATTVQELNGKLASLDKELCGANALVDEKNVEIAKLYANMFAKLLECRKTEDSSAWNSFLEEICLKITKFIENTTNLENLSYSLESANSWLTKIASIIWWSGQPAVSAIVNDNLPNVNGMNEIFRDFLLFLKNLKITVLLPVAGFCDEIKEYEANVNERSVFNKLFGSAGLSEGVLCEIYKLAINGNSGLCLIYRA